MYLTVVATYHSAFAFLGSEDFSTRTASGSGTPALGRFSSASSPTSSARGSGPWESGSATSRLRTSSPISTRAKPVRVVVAIVSVVFTILYIQVQAQGLGYIISVASDDRISFELGTLILLVVAAVYLAAGGLRAVYWTDVVQGVWMYVAIWLGALVLTYKLFGSPLELWQRVATERPDLLTLPGPQGFFTPGMWVGMMLSLCGVMLMPQMMIRYYTAVSDRTIKWLGATTPIYLASLYVPAALVGLGGALAIPDLEVADRVFPELLFRYASPWLTGVILAGAAAAAMSTLDSILHANMTVLTRDVYQRYVRTDASQAHYVWVGRAIVAALLVIGYILSITSSGYLVTLVSVSGSGALQLAPGICGVCFPGRETSDKSRGSLRSRRRARHAVLGAGALAASARHPRKHLGPRRKHARHRRGLAAHPPTVPGDGLAHPRGDRALHLRLGEKEQGINPAPVRWIGGFTRRARRERASRPRCAGGHTFRRSLPGSRRSDRKC